MYIYFLNFLYMYFFFIECNAIICTECHTLFITVLCFFLKVFLAGGWTSSKINFPVSNALALLKSSCLLWVTAVTLVTDETNMIENNSFHP